MKFVKQNNSQIRQMPIVLQTAEQNAFGDVTDPRAETGLVVEPDLVTHLSAKGASALPGHARCYRARRHPARLKHHDLPVSGQPGI